MTDVATLRRQTAANRIKRKEGTFHGRGAALLRFTVEADVEVLHNEDEPEPDSRVARRTLEGWIERNRGYVRWFNTSNIPTGGITHIESEAAERHESQQTLESERARSLEKSMKTLITHPAQ